MWLIVFGKSCDIGLYIFFISCDEGEGVIVGLCVCNVEWFVGSLKVCCGGMFRLLVRESNFGVGVRWWGWGRSRV